MTKFIVPAHAAIPAAVLIVLVIVTLSPSLLGGEIFTSGDNIFSWAPFSAEAVRPPTAVRLTSEGQNHVVLQADAPRRGYLIAVAVPPGRHLVGFEYRPASVLVGAIVSEPCLVLLGIALAARIRRGQR